jgi:hypothetical protein
MRLMVMISLPYARRFAALLLRQYIGSIWVRKRIKHWQKTYNRPRQGLVGMVGHNSYLMLLKRIRVPFIRAPQSMHGSCYDNSSYKLDAVCRLETESGNLAKG